MIQNLSMKNKIVLILTLTLFSHSCFSQDFWEPINNPGAHIYDMTVDSLGRIYLATWDENLGGIYRSDDNGETWQHKNNGIPYLYTRAIAFYRDSTLFTSLFSKLYRTSDLGENWQLVYEHFPEATSFDVIRCGFDSIILVGGENSRGILRSVDNGETWENVLNLYNDDYQEHITDIAFGPNGIIYACSRFTNSWSDEQPKVYSSIDYGKTWIPFLNLTTPSAYYSLDFDNNGRLLVGSWNGIYRFDFVLNSWEYIAINSSVMDFQVVPDNRIFLACDQSAGFGGVLLSEDGGDTYPIVLNNGLIYNSAGQFAVDAIGKLLMYPPGSSIIYKSQDTIITASHIINDLEFRNKLLVCYPNPFKKHIIFKSTINQSSKVEILDQSGSCILTFEMEPLQEYLFEAANLSPGLYIAKIESEKQLQIIKLVRQ